MSVKAGQAHSASDYDGMRSPALPHGVGRQYQVLARAAELREPLAVQRGGTWPAVRGIRNRLSDWPGSVHIDQLRRHATDDDIAGHEAFNAFAAPDDQAGAASRESRLTGGSPPSYWPMKKSCSGVQPGGMWWRRPIWLPVVSSGDHGHALQVVGEDPQPHPDRRAGQAAQPGAAQPERALEVADAGLDADPPVAHALEPSGPLHGSAGLAGRALRATPIRWTPRAARAMSLAAVPNPRAPTTVPGGRPVSAITSVTAGTSWAASPGLPLWVWWVAMKPRSHSASSTV